MSEPSFSEKCALCGHAFGQHNGVWHCPTSTGSQQFSAVPILDCPFCGRRPNNIASEDGALVQCYPCRLEWMGVERWNRRHGEVSALEIAPPNSCFFCKEWRDVDLERQRLEASLECERVNFAAVNGMLDMLARIGKAVGVENLEDGSLEENILAAFGRLKQDLACALTTVAELHAMVSLRSDCESYAVAHEKQATTIGLLRESLWSTEAERRRLAKALAKLDAEAKP